MRFSLGTAILIFLWISTFALVWQRRHPWEVTTQIVKESNVFAHESTRIAPDKLRKLEEFPEDPEGHRLKVIDIRTNKVLYEFQGFWNDESEFSVGVQFIDDNRIHAYLGLPYFSIHKVLSRRFPEWWWGHFYRPEVWALIGLTLAIAWRGVKHFRTLRATP